MDQKKLREPTIEYHDCWKVDKNQDSITIVSESAPRSSQIIGALYGVPPGLATGALTYLLAPEGFRAVAATISLIAFMGLMWFVVWWPRRASTTIIDRQNRTILYSGRLRRRRSMAFQNVESLAMSSLCVSMLVSPPASRTTSRYFWSRLDLRSSKGNLLVARGFAVETRDSAEGTLESFQNDSLLALRKQISELFSKPVDDECDECYLGGRLGWLIRRVQHPFLHGD